MSDKSGIAPDNALAWGLADRAGADPAEWPEDLRVMEWPA